MTVTLRLGVPVIEAVGVGLKAGELLGRSVEEGEMLSVSVDVVLGVSDRITDGIIDWLLVAAPVKLALKVPVADGVGDELIELVWLDSKL